MKTVLSRKILKSRDYRSCIKCGCTIVAGKAHEYLFGLDDGEWFSERTCLVCVGNRSAFAHHCGDDMGWNDELRRQTKAAVEKWEAGQ